jgi:hypothetical protein
MSLTPPGSYVRLPVNEVAVAAISTEVIVVHAAFGVVVVGGVIVVVRDVVVSAIVVAVVAAVGSLRFQLPQLLCWGLGCFCIIGFLLFTATTRLDFGGTHSVPRVVNEDGGMPLPASRGTEVEAEG